MKETLNRQYRCGAQRYDFRARPKDARENVSAAKRREPRRLAAPDYFRARRTEMSSARG